LILITIIVLTFYNSTDTFQIYPAECDFWISISKSENNS